MSGECHIPSSTLAQRLQAEGLDSYQPRATPWEEAVEERPEAIHRL